MDSFNNFNKRLETIKRFSNPDYLTRINNTKRTMATPSFQQSFQNMQYNLPNIQELTNYEQKWKEILSINAKLNTPQNLQNVVKNVTRIQAIPDYEQKMKNLIRVNSTINVSQNWQNIASDITRLQMFPNYEQKMQKLMLSIPKSNFEFIKTNEQIISITKFINNTALNYNEIIQKALNTELTNYDYQNMIKNMKSFQAFKYLPKVKFTDETYNKLMSFNRIIEKNLDGRNLYKAMSEIIAFDFDFDEDEIENDYPIISSMFTIIEAEIGQLRQFINVVSDHAITRSFSIMGAVSLVLSFSGGNPIVDQGETNSNKEVIEQIHETVSNSEKNIEDIDFRVSDGEITEVKYDFIDENDEESEVD